MVIVSDSIFIYWVLPKFFFLDCIIYTIHSFCDKLKTREVDLKLIGDIIKDLQYYSAPTGSKNFSDDVSNESDFFLFFQEIYTKSASRQMYTIIFTKYTIFYVFFDRRCD